MTEQPWLVSTSRWAACGFALQSPLEQPSARTSHHLGERAAGATRQSVGLRLPQARHLMRCRRFKLKYRGPAASSPGVSNLLFFGQRTIVLQAKRTAIGKSSSCATLVIDAVAHARRLNLRHIVNAAHAPEHRGSNMTVNIECCPLTLAQDGLSAASVGPLSRQRDLARRAYGRSKCGHSHS